MLAREAWESLVTGSRNPWLLLIHSDSRLQEIPNLAEVLHYTRLRVFTIDFGRDTSILIGRHMDFKCHRVLVVGDAILLTDGVVVAAPDEALLVVAHTRRANESKHQGTLRN